MNKKIPRINPFQITSPEDMSAEDAVSLFVEVYTDFPKIIDPGHVFLIGPRGSGKSMMFRYLMPDCQRLANNCSLNELPFLGIYVPLKNINFALAELNRIERRHASEILNSHLLTTHFALLAMKMLKELTIENTNSNDAKKTKAFFCDVFSPLLRNVSSDEKLLHEPDELKVSCYFDSMQSTCSKLYSEVLNYIKRLSFQSEILPYEGALCDYLDFFYPLLRELKQLSFLPRGPVYLLVDDAHNLSATQASVLNTWVSTRTSSHVSLKISTQPGYETYHTSSGATIDTPHDFSEVNISTIYTGARKDKYRDRVSDIVNKRLNLAKISATAESFFPGDNKQEQQIKKIADAYKAKHNKGEGRGLRPSDDAVRYARPDYIKQLSGKHKASHSYSYSGFEQLVHLSSGIIRHFIEPAHTMFSETLSKHPKQRLDKIPAGIQSAVARAEAERFLFDDLEKLENDKSTSAPPKEKIRKISNLIHGLGGMFRQCLISDRSERRVFSIAFSDTPSQEVLEILDLGVQLGYFHKSTIGRKDSKSGGRTRLYILSRRLAPVWNLDPTGFSGYLFVTSNLIQEAMSEPMSLLRRLERKGVDTEVQPGQMSLF